MATSRSVPNLICALWISSQVILLLLVATLTSSQNTVHAGGTPGQYVEQYIESVEICSLSSPILSSFNLGKKIYLSNFPNNSFVLKISRWPDYSGSFYNFKCSFKVVAPKKYGVMGIVQSLGLRNHGTTCRDFIGFKNQTSGTGPICGDLDFEDKSEKPAGLIGPRYFNSPSGDLEFIFSTSDGAFPRTGHNELFILFSAYSGECGKGMRPCSKKVQRSCIPDSMFCDKVTNCAWPGEDFGSDEKCDPGDYKDPETGSFSNFSIVFALTSIATLFLVIFFVFIICCCLQRVSKRNTLQGGVANRRGSEEDDLEFHLASTGNPTAPPHTLERGTNPIKTEDMPPPYDALFPIHSKAKISNDELKKP